MVRAANVSPEAPPAGIDPALRRHLRRIEAYMRRFGLLRFPRSRSPLRTELVRFIESRLDEIVTSWLELVSEPLEIPPAERARVQQDIEQALRRWLRHIEDPENVETYAYLWQHARGGFISRFPASRFLSSQMHACQIMAQHLKAAYGHDRDRLTDLLALLDQEFSERILHITDFFVEAREEDLAEQEATYRQAVDNAPAAIFMISDTDGTVLDANRVAERITDLGRKEMVGRRVWELHPPAEQHQVRQLCEEARGRRYSWRENLHLLTRRRDPIPIFANAGLIEYGNNHFIQLICVDISDRRRLESQLTQSEKMAALGQLAAGVAHEIRNPLGIIMNALYDLSELVDPANPEVREDLAIAKDEMERAQAIINNLLEFSRESKAELEWVDINDLLRKTLQLMGKFLQNNDVRVETDFGQLVPCLANQNALRQIVLNIITNAAQAMPRGGTLRVQSALAGSDRIQLDFTDTGVGIPPEHIDDIFNPFFTTKAAGQGTGLGLSVVHSVVRRYGGTIRVRSTVDQGTTFHIELPCRCESDATARDQAR